MSQTSDSSGHSQEAAANSMDPFHEDFDPAQAYGMSAHPSPEFHKAWNRWFDAQNCKFNHWRHTLEADIYDFEDYLEKFETKTLKSDEPATATDTVTTSEVDVPKGEGTQAEMMAILAEQEKIAGVTLQDIIEHEGPLPEVSLDEVRDSYRRKGYETYDPEAYEEIFYTRVSERFKKMCATVEALLPMIAAQETYLKESEEKTNRGRGDHHHSDVDCPKCAIAGKNKGLPGHHLHDHSCSLCLGLSLRIASDCHHALTDLEILAEDCQPSSSNDIFEATAKRIDKWLDFHTKKNMALFIGTRSRLEVLDERFFGYQESEVPDPLEGYDTHYARRAAKVPVQADDGQLD